MTTKAKTDPAYITINDPTWDCCVELVEAIFKRARQDTKLKTITDIDQRSAEEFLADPHARFFGLMYGQWKER